MVVVVAVMVVLLSNVYFIYLLTCNVPIRQINHISIYLFNLNELNSSFAWLWMSTHAIKRTMKKNTEGNEGEEEKGKPISMRSTYFPGHFPFNYTNTHTHSRTHILSLFLFHHLFFIQWLHSTNHDLITIYSENNVLPLFSTLLLPHSNNSVGYINQFVI